MCFHQGRRGCTASDCMGSVAWRCISHGAIQKWMAAALITFSSLAAGPHEGCRGQVDPVPELSKRVIVREGAHLQVHMPVSNLPSTTGCCAKFAQWYQGANLRSGVGPLYNTYSLYVSIVPLAALCRHTR